MFFGPGTTHRCGITCMVITHYTRIFLRVFLISGCWHLRWKIENKIDWYETRIKIKALSNVYIQLLKINICGLISSDFIYHIHNFSQVWISRYFSFSNKVFKHELTRKSAIYLWRERKFKCITHTCR